MGIYLNPGNTAFQKALNSDIYIDKTDLIAITNDKIGKTDCFMCVSRPRRFGKSMAADMLVAYYSKGCLSGELFAGRKAETKSSFRAHLNQHNVIRLDIQQFLFRQSHLDIFIDKIQEAVIRELHMIYGDCFNIDQYGLPGVLNQINAQTGAGFIFIIDEWDCVFRIAKENKHIQKTYLDFLRGLFKGSDYVELAYMTGILPVKKYGEHSAINMFGEYSMTDPKNLGRYFGFTREEVQMQCSCPPPIPSEDNPQETDITYAEVEKWYDGYLLGGLHIYNPKSVVDVLTWREFQSYWTGTETYEALKVYIEMDFDGLKQAITAMLGNSRCKIDPSTFQNDMTTFKTKDDVLTLLVHLGYLTYNRKTSEVLIPNQEIMEEFMRAMKVGGWEGVIQAINRSDDLMKSTWALDGDAVAAGVAAIHNETSSLLNYNSENALTCTLLMAYYSAKAYYMNPIMELPAGKGIADVVYLPKRGLNYPALVVELKWDKSAKGAIQQIKDKQYVSWIEEYTGDILLIGINYIKKEKAHECIIETYHKDLP